MEPAYVPSRSAVLRTRASRTIRSVAIRGVRTVGLAWLVMASILFFMQDALVFPAPTAPLPDPGSIPRAGGFSLEHLVTSDGLHLAFWAQPPLPGKPVILFFHGNGSAAHGGARYLGPLHREGYGIVLAEYRGYSGNPGHPSEEGLARDARAYADWAAANYGAGLPVVMGESLGTGVAVTLASERPVRGLVLDSAFPSIADVVHAGFFFWAPTILLRNTFDSVHRIGRVTAPVAMLHGSSDTMMPASFDDRLAAAAPCVRGRLERQGIAHLVLGNDMTAASHDFVVAFLATLKPDGSCTAP